MSAHEMIGRAADLLQEVADSVHACHTIRGEWNDTERDARDYYEDLTETVGRLRALAEEGS